MISLVMAVVLGAQTRTWAWGPAMLALGIATLFAIVSIWRSKQKLADTGLTILGVIVAGWFAWRAWMSPVSELALADVLLLSGSIATYICMRAIISHKWAEKTFVWGIAILLLANIIIVAKQVMEPGYNPIFQNSTNLAMVSGFYFHYNEAANFFIASSMLVLAAGLFGKDRIQFRVLWVLIAIAGLVCVWYTRSRGGILGMAVASGVFATFGIVVAKRANSRWFAPLLVVIPVIGMATLGFLFYGWQAALEARNASGGALDIFDNISRLYILGLGIACIGLHPLLGGGSRSFSWECFQFANVKSQGSVLTHRPEQAHNELLQAATDYGLIGAGLLLILLVTFFIVIALKVFFEDRKPKQVILHDAWRIGAIAAMAGMLVQSSFSFVFHLFPGVMLLGICLAQMVRSQELKLNHLHSIGNKLLLTLTAVGCCIFLIPFGWKGAGMMQALWPVFFSKDSSVSYDARIEKISAVIERWPQTELYQERALIHLALAGLVQTPTEVTQAKEAAAEDFQEAARLHPYDPAFLINGSNLLSALERDQEAEIGYAKAIQLQGGMEPAFRGKLSSSIHYLKKGVRLFSQGSVPQALQSLEIALAQIKDAAAEMHWMAPDILVARVAIYESLGTAQEATGDFVGAKNSYKLATTLPGGNRANYRLGSLFGKLASQAWAARRSSEALGYFDQAKHHISIAQELPAGTTLSQRVEYLAYLDQTIAFLKAAKVTPPPVKEGD